MYGPQSGHLHCKHLMSAKGQSGERIFDETVHGATMSRLAWLLMSSSNCLVAGMLKPFAAKEPQHRSAAALFIMRAMRLAQRARRRLNFSSSEFEPDCFRSLRLLYALTVASPAQDLGPAL